MCTSPSLLTGDSALATSGAASGGGEAGLFASFLPSRPGTYRVELTADDGCSVFRDSLTLDVRCPPETSTPLLLGWPANPAGQVAAPFDGESPRATSALPPAVAAGSAASAAPQAPQPPISHARALRPMCAAPLLCAAMAGGFLPVLLNASAAAAPRAAAPLAASALADISWKVSDAPTGSALPTSAAGSAIVPLRPDVSATEVSSAVSAASLALGSGLRSPNGRDLSEQGRAALAAVVARSDREARQSPLALLLPDTAGSFSVEATVSDGCGSRTVAGTVVTACPAGVAADAGPDRIVVSAGRAGSAPVDLSELGAAEAGSTALLAAWSSSSAGPNRSLAEAVAGSAFSAVLLRANGTAFPELASNGSSFFWELVDAPVGSALPAALLASAVDGAPPHRRSRGRFALPRAVAGRPVVYGSSAALVPDVEGVYRLRVTVSDGCAVATDDVTVTASCASPPIPRVAPSAELLGGFTTVPSASGGAGAVEQAPVVVLRVGSALAHFANATRLREAASAAARTAVGPADLVVNAPAEPPSALLNGTLADDGAGASAGAGVSVEWSLLTVPRAGSAAAAGEVGSWGEAPCAGSVMSDACRAGARSVAAVSDRRLLSGARLVVDSVGDYAVSLRAADNCSSRAVPMVVSVRCNAPPVANAGGHQRVLRGPRNAFVPVAVDGSASTDPDPEDASRLRYSWELLAAPAGSSLAALAPAEPFGARAFASTASFTPDVNGQYSLRLTVSDWCSSSSDVVTVTVSCNGAPRAGVNGHRQTVRFNATASGLGNGSFPSVALDGTYSHDPDGLSDISSYQWTLTGVSSPAAGFAKTFGAGGGPDYTTPLAGFGRGEAVLFTPPAQQITAAADTGGGAASVLYTVQLAVSDGCASDTTAVVVEALCPTSPFATAAASPVSLVWNARPGSRFGTSRAAFDAQAAATGLSGVGGEDLEAAACAVNASASAPGQCAMQASLTGGSQYLHPNQTWTWSVDSVPSGAAAGAALLTQPAGPSAPALGHAAAASLVVGMPAYDALRPFDAASLGASLAGDYDLRFTVAEPCVASSANVTVALRCNDRPSAAARVASAVVVASADTGVFAPVALVGSNGTHPSVQGSAAELEADAPTFRFEWSVQHEPLPAAEARGFVSSVTGAAEPEATLTGAEAAAGFHHVFVTSTGYDGNLGGTAGADDKCRRHARLAGHAMPDDFVAVLCTSGASGYGRVAVTGPVYTSLGLHGGYRDASALGRSAKVACGPAETECQSKWTSDNWLRDLAYDEFGARLPGTNPLISGCTPAGAVLGGSSLCGDWTSSSASLSHVVGNPFASGTRRYNALSTRTCSQPAHLLCVRATARNASALGMPAGPLQSLDPSFTPTRLGTYTATLRVTDGCTAATASVNITARCPDNAGTPVDVGSDIVVTWSRPSLAAGGSFGRATATVIQPGEEALGQWTVEQEDTLGAAVSPEMSFPVPGDLSGARFSYAAAVLGNVTNAADLPASQNLRAPSFVPGSLGTYRFRFSVPGACVVSSDEVVVNATCNAPPRVTVQSELEGSAPGDVPVLVSRWNGTAFRTVNASGLASDADGDALTYGASFVAPGHVAPASPLPITDPSVLGPDPAAIMVLSGGADVALAPTRLGSWTVTLSASDGCTVVQQNVSVWAVCGAPPEASFRGAAAGQVGAGGATTSPPTSPLPGTAGAPGAAPLNASVFASSSAPGNFSSVQLDALSRSTSANGGPLTFAWNVSAFAPVAAFSTAAAGAAAGAAPGNNSADDPAAGAAFEAALAPRWDGSPGTVSFERSVAGAIVADPAAAAAAGRAMLRLADASAASSPANGSAALPPTSGVVEAAPERLGRWLVDVTVSDGCLRNTTSAVVAAVCSAPPVAAARAAVIADSGIRGNFSQASRVAVAWGSGRPNVTALLANGTAFAEAIGSAGQGGGPYPSPYEGASPLQARGFAPVVVEAGWSADADATAGSLVVRWRLAAFSPVTVANGTSAWIPAGAESLEPGLLMGSVTSLANVSARIGSAGTGQTLPAELASLFAAAPATSPLGGAASDVATPAGDVVGRSLTLLPRVLGEYVLEAEVSDGCSFTRAFVNVSAVCNAAPSVALPASPVVALWKGVASGFGAVPLVAALSDSDNDTLTSTWSLEGDAVATDADGAVIVPGGNTSAGVNASLLASPTSPGAVSLSVAGGVAAPSNATLFPRTLARRGVRVAVSDGCSVAGRTVDVLTACPAAPSVLLRAVAAGTLDAVANATAAWQPSAEAFEGVVLQAVAATSAADGPGGGLYPVSWSAVTSSGEAVALSPALATIRTPGTGAAVSTSEGAANATDLPEAVAALGGGGGFGGAVRVSQRLLVAPRGGSITVTVVVSDGCRSTTERIVVVAACGEEPGAVAAASVGGGGAAVAAGVLAGNASAAAGFSGFVASSVALASSIASDGESAAAAAALAGSAVLDGSGGSGDAAAGRAAAAAGRVWLASPQEGGLGPVSWASGVRPAVMTAYDGVTGSIVPVFLNATSGSVGGTAGGVVWRSDVTGAVLAGSAVVSAAQVRPPSTAALSGLSSFADGGGVAFGVRGAGGSNGTWFAGEPDPLLPARAALAAVEAAHAGAANWTSRSALGAAQASLRLAEQYGSTFVSWPLRAGAALTLASPALSPALRLPTGSASGSSNVSGVVLSANASRIALRAGSAGLGGLVFGSGSSAGEVTIVNGTAAVVAPGGLGIVAAAARVSDGCSASEAALLVGSSCSPLPPVVAVAPRGANASVVRSAGAAGAASGHWSGVANATLSALDARGELAAAVAAASSLGFGTATAGSAGAAGAVAGAPLGPLAEALSTAASRAGPLSINWTVVRFIPRPAAESLTVGPGGILIGSDGAEWEQQAVAHSAAAITDPLASASVASGPDAAAPGGSVNVTSPQLRVRHAGTVVLSAVSSDGCLALTHAVEVNVSCAAPPRLRLLPGDASSAATLWNASAGAAEPGFAPIAVGVAPADASLSYAWSVQPTSSAGQAGLFARATVPCNETAPTSSGPVPMCAASLDAPAIANGSAVIATPAEGSTAVTLPGVGDWTLRLRVSDGCRANSSSVALRARCNDRPVLALPDASTSLINASGSDAAAAFTAVPFEVVATDANADVVTVTATPVSHAARDLADTAPEHVALGRINSSARADGPEPLLSALLAGAGSASGAGSVSLATTLTPTRLGTTVVAVSATDGCTRLAANVTVTAKCRAPGPLPEVLPAAGSAGSASLRVSYGTGSAEFNATSLLVAGSEARFVKSDAAAALPADVLSRVQASLSGAQTQTNGTSSGAAAAVGASVRLFKRAFDTAAEREALPASLRAGGAWGLELPLPPLSRRNVSVAFASVPATLGASLRSSADAAAAAAAALRGCSAQLTLRADAVAVALAANASLTAGDAADAADAAALSTAMPRVAPAGVAALPALSIDGLCGGGSADPTAEALALAGGRGASAAAFQAATATLASQAAAANASTAAMAADAAVAADAEAAVLSNASSVALQRASWSFLGWVLVDRKCPRAALDAASAPGFAEGLFAPALSAGLDGGAGAVGQCLLGPEAAAVAAAAGPQGGPGSLPALVGGGETAPWFAPQGLGAYTLRWAATDGCNVAAGDVVVSVECAAEPLVALDASALRVSPSLGATGWGVTAADRVGVAVATDAAAIAAALAAHNNGSTALAGPAAALQAAGVDVLVHLAASPITGSGATGPPRLPAVVINASGSWDRLRPEAAASAAAAAGALTPGEEAEPPRPLRFVWDVVSAPARSRLQGQSGLSHPNATSVGLLAAASPASVTGTFGPAGLSGTPEQLALLRAGNGSAAAYAAANALSAESVVAFSPDQFGRYVIRITVHDGCSVRSALAVVDATCTQPPVVSAGADRSVTRIDAGGPALAWSADGRRATDTRVFLDASGTADPDWTAQDASGSPREPVFVQWRIDAVPAGAAAALSNASSARPHFRPTVPGAYTLRVFASNSPAADLSAPRGSAAGPACPVSSDVVTITAGCGPAPVAVASQVLPSAGQAAFGKAIANPLLASAALAGGETAQPNVTADKDAAAAAGVAAAAAAAPLELPAAAWAAAARLVAAAEPYAPGRADSTPVVAGFSPVLVTAMASTDSDSVSDFRSGSTDVQATAGRWTAPAAPLAARWRLVAVPAGSRSAALVPGPAAAAARLRLPLVRAMLQAAAASSGGAVPDLAAVTRAAAWLVVPSADVGAVGPAAGAAAWPWGQSSLGAAAASGGASGEVGSAATGAGAVTGVNATLLPDAPGTYTLALDVSDGCSSSSTTVDVVVACSAAPALVVTAATAAPGSGNQTATVSATVASGATSAGPPALRITHRLSGLLAAALAGDAAAQLGSGNGSLAPARGVDVAGSADAFQLFRLRPGASQASADAVALGSAVSAAELAPLTAPLGVAAAPGDEPSAAEVADAATARLVAIAAEAARVSGVALNASHAAGTRAAGSPPLAFRWSIASRPGASVRTSVGGAMTANAVVVPDAVGVFRVTVSATDGCAAAAPGAGPAAVTAASVEVDAVCSLPPVVALPNGSSSVSRLHRQGGVAVQLPAVAVSDPDDSVLAWRWSVASVTAGSGAGRHASAGGGASASPFELVNATSADGGAWLRVFVPGSYVAEFVATDGCSRVAASVVVNVLCPAPRRSPVAAAAALGRGAVSPHIPGSWVNLRGAFDFEAFLQAEAAPWQSGLAGQGNASLLDRVNAASAAGVDPGAALEPQAAAALAPLLDAVSFRWSVLPVPPVVDAGGPYIGSPNRNVTLGRVTLRVPGSGSALPADVKSSAAVTAMGEAGLPLSPATLTGIRWSLQGAPTGALTAPNSALAGTLGPVLMKADTLAPVLAPSLAGTYSLRVDAFAGCDPVSATADVLVACSGQPNARFANAVVSASLGDVVSVDASASTATSSSGLTYRWELLGADGTPGGAPVDVRSPGPLPLKVLSDAASLRAPAATALTNAAVTLLAPPATAGGPATVLGTADAGEVGGAALARFQPDGLGDYRLRVTVSDGCSSDWADVVVRVGCPADAADGTALGGAPAWKGGSALASVAAVWMTAAPSTVSGADGSVSQGPGPAGAAGVPGAMLTSSGVSVRFQLSRSPPSQPSGWAGGDTLVVSWQLTAVPAASGLAVGQSLGGGFGTGDPSSSSAITLDVAGIYTATATVSDGCAVAEASSSIVVAPDAPALFAGGTYSVATVGNAAASASVRLSDVRFVDRLGRLVPSAEAAAPVAGLSVAWSVLAAPAGSSASAAALLTPSSGVLAPLFRPDVPGRYVLRVSVSGQGNAATAGGAGPTLTDSVVVEAACGEGPVAAVAGAPIVRAFLSPPPVLSGVQRASVSLDAGSASSDADSPAGSLTYTWQATSSSVRRPGAAVSSSVSDAASLQTTPATTSLTASDYTATGSPAGSQVAFVPDGIGTYGMRVTVNDGCSSAQAFAAVEVACSDDGLAAVSAGATVEVEVPVGGSLPASVAVAATASTGSGDGTLAGALVASWTVESAPPGSGLGAGASVAEAVHTAEAVPGSASGSFRLATSASLQPDALGSYLLRVTVSDGCRTASSTMAVHVRSAAALVCPSFSSTPTPSTTASVTPSSTATPSLGASASPTAPPTQTPTPSSSAGSSPSGTPSASGTSLPPPPTASPTVSASSTRAAGASPSPTASGTPAAAVSPAASATPTPAPSASSCPAAPVVGSTSTVTSTVVSFSVRLQGASASDLSSAALQAALRRQIATAAGVDVSAVSLDGVAAAARVLVSAPGRRLQASRAEVQVAVPPSGSVSAQSVVSAVEAAMADGTIRSGINSDSAVAAQGVSVTSTDLPSRPVIERSTSTTQTVADPSAGEEAVPFGLFVAAAVLACILLLLLVVGLVAALTGRCGSIRGGGGAGASSPQHGASAGSPAGSLSGHDQSLYGPPPPRPGMSPESGAAGFAGAGAASAAAYGAPPTSARSFHRVPSSASGLQASRAVSAPRADGLQRSPSGIRQPSPGGAQSLASSSAFPHGRAAAAAAATAQPGSGRFASPPAAPRGRVSLRQAALAARSFPNSPAGASFRGVPGATPRYGAPMTPQRSMGPGNMSRADMSMYRPAGSFRSTAGSGGDAEFGRMG